MTILCVDFGSTFTKAAARRRRRQRCSARRRRHDGTQRRRHPRRLPHAARRARGARRRREVLACSSAGGGLRLAVVGYERTSPPRPVTGSGCRRARKVVHVDSGSCRRRRRRRRSGRRARTSSCSSGVPTAATRNVLLHNAARLAKAPCVARVPVVVAGNVEARDEVAATCPRRGRRPSRPGRQRAPADRRHRAGVRAGRDPRGLPAPRHRRQGAVARTRPSPRWSRQRRPTPCCDGVEVLASATGRRRARRRRRRCDDRRLLRA